MMYKKAISIKLLVICIGWVFCLSELGWAGASLPEKTSTKEVLILKDRDNYYGDSRDAVTSLAYLLKHFVGEVTIGNINETMDLEPYDYIFVIKFGEDTLDESGIKALTNFKGKIYWIGEGVGLLPASQTGLSYIGKTRNMTGVSYKYKSYDIGVPRDFNVVEVASSARILANLSDGAYDYPFITKNHNFYYLSRLDLNEPLYYIFADSLYDFFDQNPEQNQKVLLLLGTIYPYTKAEPLQKQIYYLLEHQIPFALSVNPFYRETPQGFTTYLSEQGELVKVLKWAESQGGRLFVQGGTQYLDGMDFKADDFFTWQGKQKRTEGQWIDALVGSSLEELHKCQLHPIGFDLRGYRFTERAYQEMGEIFNCITGYQSLERWTEGQSVNPWMTYDKAGADYILPNVFGLYDDQEINALDALNQRFEKVSLVRELTGTIYLRPETQVEALTQLIGYMEEKEFEWLDMKQYPIVINHKDYALTLGAGMAIEASHGIEPLFRLSWRVVVYIFLGFLTWVMVLFYRLYRESKAHSDKTLFEKRNFK